MWRHGAALQCCSGNRENVTSWCSFTVLQWKPRDYDVMVQLYSAAVETARLWRHGAALQFCRGNHWRLGCCLSTVWQTAYLRVGVLWDRTHMNGVSVWPVSSCSALSGWCAIWGYCTRTHVNTVNAWPVSSCSALSGWCAIWGYCTRTHVNTVSAWPVSSGSAHTPYNPKPHC